MATQRKTQSRSTTAAASRPRIDREQVVHAALQLLGEGGIAALSTRQLAQRLGVKSPSLYWHFRDKDELLDLVADAICAEAQLPASDLSFRQRLEQISWEYRRILLRYRDAPALFAERPPTGPHRLRLYDAALGPFLDNGFSATESVAMAAFFRNYLLGMIAEEARQAALSRAQQQRLPQALAAQLKMIPGSAALYPNLSRVAGELVRVDPEALFAIGLKVQLDGMEARMRRRGARGALTR
ncbi:TetR/AcrR family transcriptional regulator C-terminal domain-containing protein [Tahibacter amnicola]|uniref:TetR/AcrR family transcriptional regulator C-terminal domain-containing protein n=1 Tax=Tahibacter amnicola TaxID=2976241 RepID=A0ABY6BEG2_9GAMM|nr:TetR/AcrR family transcriptional regulator C-terminal domain-containing protein [Tahibacter amnicola]UXI66745.1 TetR/AcrR family transcriptional regulator C-terminal domain-containing protein [Tahibacter amnicola]